jgi:hypothetical protein
MVMQKKHLAAVIVLIILTIGFFYKPESLLYQCKGLVDSDFRKTLTLSIQIQEYPLFLQLIKQKKGIALIQEPFNSADVYSFIENTGEYYLADSTSGKGGFFGILTQSLEMDVLYGKFQGNCIEDENSLR